MGYVRNTTQEAERAVPCSARTHARTKTIHTSTKRLKHKPTSFGATLDKQERNRGHSLILYNQ